MFDMAWKKLKTDERLRLFRSWYRKGYITARELGPVMGIDEHTVSAFYVKNIGELSDCPIKIQKRETTIGTAPLPSMVPEPDFICEPVTMAELSDHGCRWPVNDDYPVMFCNNPRNTTSSYCHQHTRSMSGPGTRSERNALEGLKI